jgi:hypothetical protein
MTPSSCRRGSAQWCPLGQSPGRSGRDPPRRPPVKPNSRVISRGCEVCKRPFSWQRHERIHLGVIPRPHPDRKHIWGKLAGRQVSPNSSGSSSSVKIGQRSPFSPTTSSITRPSGQADWSVVLVALPAGSPQAQTRIVAVSAVSWRLMARSRGSGSRSSSRGQEDTCRR